MFTAPDEHMPYIIQLHIMSIQLANKAAEQRERQTDGQRAALGMGLFTAGFIIIIHSFYIALFSALEQTHCAHGHASLNE